MLLLRILKIKIAKQNYPPEKSGGFYLLNLEGQKMLPFSIALFISAWYN